jgi:hypothetical protein
MAKRPTLETTWAIPASHGVSWAPWSGKWSVPKHFIARFRDPDCELEIKLLDEGRPTCVAVRCEDGVTGSLLRTLPIEALVRQATAVAAEANVDPVLGPREMPEKRESDVASASTAFAERHGERRPRTVTRERLELVAELWRQGEQLGVGGANHVKDTLHLSYPAVYKLRRRAEDEGLIGPPPRSPRVKR